MKKKLVILMCLGLVVASLAGCRKIDLSSVNGAVDKYNDTVDKTEKLKQKASDGLDNFFDNQMPELEKKLDGANK